MKKSIISKIISLILVTAMLVVLVKMPVAAAEENATYISDVKIGYDDDNGAAGADRSKKALRDQGYTVVDKDLNSGTGEGWAYIGYKTTKNKDEAITDIAMMSEQCGYSFSDYQELLKKQYSSYEKLADYEMDLLKDFRIAYAAKKPLAVNAYLSLNNFKEDDSGKLVGDYLLDENLSKDDLFKFITQISQCALYSFNNLLVAAIAEDSTDSFITRLSAMTSEDIAAAKADPTLYDSAKIIYNQLESFRTSIKNVVSQAEIKDATDSSGAEPTEEEIKATQEYYKTHQDELAQKISEFEGANAWTTLKTATCGGVSLYDILMNENIEITELYPLVKSMKKSHIGASALYGLFELFNTAGLGDSKTYSVSDIEKAQEKNKTEAISAYYGVDRSMFKSTVAITSAAARDMNSTGDKHLLYGNVASSTELGMAIAAGVAAGVAVISFIAVTACWASIYGVSGTVQLALFSIKPAELISTVSEFFGDFSFSVLYNSMLFGILFYVAIAAAIIISATLVIMELYNYYNPTYSTVPTILLDMREKNGEKTYFRYDGVTTVGGEMGDLNGYAGHKWNAVYTTKDSSAGKPILANTLVFKKAGENPGKKYIALHSFGTDTAVNINNYTFNDETSIYLYFASDTSYKPTTASTFSSVALPMITGVGGLLVGAFVVLIATKKKKVAAKENAAV